MSEERGDEEGGGWQVVENRRNRKQKGGTEKEQVTFYFRNFPDHCSEEDLRRNFEPVGRVEDIFLPEKRDKMGKRFGFVRFRQIEEPGRILERLNKVWIGSYIIRAFLPRFERPPENKRTCDTREVRKGREVGVARTGIGADGKRKGLAYASVLQGTHYGERKREW